ncbi:hypothetical protein RGQ29_003128 [Quercus rubra]|uniref:RING-type E3 ubiquitin transferase n=1 Tax=Quercus rubra TaxID=3512 RepID=A0AAN7EB38_QUERU|nr:hypothetical protein RGQ29_003128 [Quercus rubra]
MESTYNFHIWEEDELPDYNVDDIRPNTQYFFINLYFRLVSEEYSQTTFLVSSNDLFNKTTTIMDSVFSDAPVLKTFFPINLAIFDTPPVTDFMDPATKSSIAALKKVKIDGSCTSSDPCSICLNDFCDGSEVMVMPCLHLYHKDCIVRWLETSHLCPLCRYPMPTRRIEDEIEAVPGWITPFFRVLLQFFCCEFLM